MKLVGLRSPRIVSCHHHHCSHWIVHVSALVILLLPWTKIIGCSSLVVSNTIRGHSSGWLHHYHHHHPEQQNHGFSFVTKLILDNKINHNRRLYTTSSSSLSLSLTTSSSSASFPINETSSSSSSSYWDEPEDFGDEEEDEEEDLVNNENESSTTSSLLFKEYNLWSQSIHQTLEKLKKKQSSLESELTKAQGLEQTTARAQLLVNNLYLFQNGDTSSAVVTDWETGTELELTLDPKYESASEEANALFAQAKKLKRGSQVVSKLLQETQTAMDILTEAQVDLQFCCTTNTDPDSLETTTSTTNIPNEPGLEYTPTIDSGRLQLVQERLIRTARTTNFQIPTIPKDDDDSSASSDSSANNNKKRNSFFTKKPEIGTPASNIRKLTSPGGCTVLVGRNRRGNEYLSVTLARGNDIWMHSRGCPGAHVLIQNRRGGPTPTEDCFQFAANVAIFYSDFRTESKAPVTAAEPKHLLKPKNAPLGAIKLREEWKTFVGYPNQVPEFLKEAREESGQSNDYYRSMDKAKHRRRTKQQQQQHKEKE